MLCAGPLSPAEKEKKKAAEIGLIGLKQIFSTSLILSHPG